jgi:hypothetical protein
MVQEGIFKGLPKWAQGVIAIAIIGGAGFVGFKIYKGIQKRKELEGSKNEISEAKQEADNLNQNPTTAQKISAIQMAVFANSLHEALNGVGTQVNGVYKVFANMNNKADVLGLIKAYGSRKINSGIYLVPDYEGSLSGALINELDNLEITALNMMLAKKAIGIRF